MPLPAGRFVVLVGPDGVGKTSVAAELQTRLDARYFHFRPKLGEPWSDPEPGQVLEKPRHDSGRIESVMRLVLNLVRFWLGFLLRVRPELTAGRDVLADRWAYGYVAKPQELRYFGPAALARLMVRLLPQPTAVVCLVAPASVIHARKPELAVSEISEDLERWREVPAANLFEIEATDPPAKVAATIVERLGLV